MRVLITTSGLGYRLGSLTKYNNKALVKVGDKATISYIIDLYPDATFVITLGHFGDYVKQFLEITYPEKKFEFVYVDPYEGEGSGLLTSMSFARDKLQCPFIFHVCDTILTNTPPRLDYNWMACAVEEPADFFRTVNVKDGTILKINEKGEVDYDYAYVGVAGIFDYKKFWNELDKAVNMRDSSDCHVFNRMLSDTTIKSWVIGEWYDTGSVVNLSKTRKFFNQEYNVLDKPEESIYFVGDSVVKFFSDGTLCKNRIRRAKILEGIVPELIDSSKNFYKYKFVDGELLSRVLTEDKLVNLITWAENELWKPIDIDRSEFTEKCMYFYLSKTKDRINKFLSLSGVTDKIDTINRVSVPNCSEILDKIDWDNICDTSPTQFHGDFILDNILYVDGTFVPLDWRQDFAGEIEAGDKYYDLAKLNHNLTLNHDLISKEYFKIKITEDDVQCDILRSHNMTLSQQKFMEVVKEKGYDQNKIKIITALIWLNMSPLHTYPLNTFLFYFGKYNLWRELCINYI